MLCYTKFWPKKVYFKAKIDIFLIFSAQMQSSKENIILKFVFVITYRNMKNNPQK